MRDEPLENGYWERKKFIIIIVVACIACSCELTSTLEVSFLRALAGQRRDPALSELEVDEDCQIYECQVLLGVC